MHPRTGIQRAAEQRGEFRQNRMLDLLALRTCNAAVIEMSIAQPTLRLRLSMPPPPPRSSLPQSGVAQDLQRNKQEAEAEACSTMVTTTFISGVG